MQSVCTGLAAGALGNLPVVAMEQPDLQQQGDALSEAAALRGRPTERREPAASGQKPQTHPRQTEPWQIPRAFSTAFRDANPARGRYYIDTR